VQCEHEVGLFDDLLTVEIEVRKVKEQGVLVGLGVLEVPDLMVRKALRLRVDASRDPSGSSIPRDARNERTPSKRCFPSMCSS
jgi:hypothetical protein